MLLHGEEHMDTLMIVAVVAAVTGAAATSMWARWQLGRPL